MNHGFGILSALIFSPVLGAILLALVPAEYVKVVRAIALATTVATLAIAVSVVANFRGSTYHFQMMESIPWIPQFGISYFLGIDGISLWLVALTALLGVVAVAVSLYQDQRVRSYMIFLLLLESTMLGIFLSLDMVLFYTFFEASLIPMYFMIAIWGGERREYAARKVFIYLFGGSILMLVGMIWLFLINRDATQGAVSSFSILQLQHSAASGKLWAGALQFEPVIFWMFALAFLVKSPAFPFHTWLPDAYAQGPVSVVLLGVLVKTGTYGFLRFCLPLFPDVVPNVVPIFMVLAVVGIVYGGIVAAVQTDLNKLLAYSSVSHIGFILLGIFSLSQSGMVGGAIQQVNHGISAAALFVLLGFLYLRRPTRHIKDFGGLKAQMPVFAALFLVAVLSSVGLPGTNGFIGEFLALLGAFQSGYARAFGFGVEYAVVAAIGVILAAVYLLPMFQKVFYGPVRNPLNRQLRDLKPWEAMAAAVFLPFVFWIGLYPNTFLKPMEAAVAATRMMAINPAGARPDWSDLSSEIDGKMNLVQVGTRSEDELGTPLQRATIVAPASNNPVPPESTPAQRTRRVASSGRPHV